MLASEPPPSVATLEPALLPPPTTGVGGPPVPPLGLASAGPPPAGGTPPVGGPPRRGPPRDSRHVCEHCNKTFYSHKGLQQHLIIHTDQKPHICDICQKPFRFKSNLFEHKSLHTGAQPYVCPVCNKTCRLKGNLKKHLKTHEKNGELEDLEAAFRQIRSFRGRKSNAQNADSTGDFIMKEESGEEHEPDEFAEYVVEEREHDNSVLKQHIPSTSDHRQERRKSTSHRARSKNASGGNAPCVLPGTGFVFPSGAGDPDSVASTATYHLVQPYGAGSHTDPLSYDPTMATLMSTFDGHPYHSYHLGHGTLDPHTSYGDHSTGANHVEPKVEYHHMPPSQPDLIQSASLQPQSCQDLNIDVPKDTPRLAFDQPPLSSSNLERLELPTVTLEKNGDGTEHKKLSNGLSSLLSGSTDGLSLYSETGPSRKSSLGDRLNVLWQEFRNIAFQTSKDTAGNSNYACQACGVYRRYRAELRVHFQREHAGCHSCEACLRVFDSDEKRREHASQHARIIKLVSVKELSPKVVEM